MTNDKSSIIKQLSIIEFINYLHSCITLTNEVKMKLLSEQIDGDAFLLMEKSDLSEVNLYDRYIELCYHFPMANFVNDFI